MGRRTLRDILAPEEWLVREDGFDRTTANIFETLFTVGNGRHGTRGALEEGHASSLSGVFVAGVYDAHDAIVTDLVNAPDWVDTVVYAGGYRLDVDTCRVVEHQRALDISQGVVWRSTTFEDPQGRRTRLESVRFAPMQLRDTAVLRMEVTALNHASPVRISTGIDGDRTNLEALPVYPAGRVFAPEEQWAKWARSRHLETLRVDVADGRLGLTTRTRGTGVELAVSATVSLTPEPVRTESLRTADRVTLHASYDAAPGQTLRLDKVMALRTSRDVDAKPGEDLLARADGILETVESIEDLLAGNAITWRELWGACDAEILGEDSLTRAVRFGIYHLLIAADPDDPTVNIGAKSLSGEGYRGHVFWDTEVMMLPFFVLTLPATARALLGYRFHTLDGARRNSAEHGTAGARFAWESADTGDEECPLFTPDGKDRFWTRDQAIHVSADIAYAIKRYVRATGDERFLSDEGAEILFETSRFWVSRAEVGDAGSWHLRQVSGPDEFHSHVDDNAFTNTVARWALRYAVEVYDELGRTEPAALATITQRIGLSPSEVERWTAVADGLADPHRDESGVIEQFAGFFDLEYVPVTEWDENQMPRYPEGYTHFNSEGTQLVKQPDVLQMMLMTPDAFTAEEVRANFEFYEPRTLHKSSLSPAIHAIMGIEAGDPTRAVQYFERSALVDLTDNQGNTAQGMHIASAAGTWMALTHGFGGLRIEGDRLALRPWLPPQWSGVRYRVTWHGLRFTVEVGRETVTLDADPRTEGTRLSVDVAGQALELKAGAMVTVDLVPSVNER